MRFAPTAAWLTFVRPSLTVALRLVVVPILMATLWGCEKQPLTQLVLEIRSDLNVPDEVDEVYLSVAGLGPDVREASAYFDEGQTFPRQVSIVQDDPNVSTVQLNVVAKLGGTEVLSRRATVAFIENETRYLSMGLVKACIGVICENPEQTCGEGGCRDVAVAEDELLNEDQANSPDNNRRPDGQCLEIEECNGLDDDCDDAIDEGFALASDPNNCGACGNVCAEDEVCGNGSCRAREEAIEVAAGGSHACLKTVDGLVKCWGDNASCAVGGVAGGEALTPRNVAALAEVTQLSLGRSHSCALTQDGTVYCWGSNTAGQLGQNAPDDHCEPTEVAGLTASHLSAGASHTCAVDASGSVICWGDNTAGQLGRDGEGGAPSAVLDLPEGAAALQVSCGERHTCVLLDNGQVYCFGDNSLGQLANDEAEDEEESSAPVRAGNLTGVAELSAGANHTCVRLQSGTVACWGDNSQGQLGREGPNEKAPAPVPTLANVLGVSAGLDHSCVALQGGGLACFGSDAEGQRGDGPPVRDDLVTDVRRLSNARTVSAGDAFACAARLDGAVACWGKNDKGQLGRGANPGQTAFPSNVVGVP